MIRVVVTDLDDTLYSWLGFFIPAFYAMANKVSDLTNVPLSTLLAEYREVHQKVGSVEYPLATLQLPSVLALYPSSSPEELAELLDPAFHEFNSTRKRKLKLFPGVKEALSQIVNDGISLIGYTDSPSENGFYRLKRLGISGLFDRVYCSQSDYVSRPDPELNDKVIEVSSKKPCPDLLLKICSDYHIHPNEMAYLGDSLPKDILMAKLAGTYSILVDIPLPANDWKKQLIAISSWTDLDFSNYKTYVEKWNQGNYEPDYILRDYNSLYDAIARVE